MKNKDKICPKCKSSHSKGGIYCSMKCANSSKKVWNKGLNKNTSPIIKEISEKIKGKTGWSKGLTKETDPRILKSSNSLKNNGNAKGVGSTPEIEAERRRKISKYAKSNNGGYRRGSGRGLKGWYKGFFCDSSYELAYVIYCLEHNIPISRNLEKRQYIWKNETRTYIPDFIVDGELVEIKGYKTDQWLAKHDHNKDIKVLYEKDLKEVFTYVVEKHGKNFVKLYEK